MQIYTFFLKLQIYCRKYQLSVDKSCTILFVCNPAMCVQMSV